MPDRCPPRGRASWQIDCRLARAVAVNPGAFGAPFGLRGIDSSARPSKRATMPRMRENAASLNIELHQG